MHIIEMNNITFKYNDNVIFENLNLNILNNSWTTILGNNGSGKTTLLRIMVGLINSMGEIFVLNRRLTSDNKDDILKYFGVLFSNIDNAFVCDKVMDEIVFVLENLKYERSIIDDKLKEVTEIFKLDNLLDETINSLNRLDKVKVALASIIIKEPKILILDEILSLLDHESKKVIIKILEKIKKKYKLTIINITNEINDSLLGDRIVLIDQGKIQLEGDLEVLKEESKFSEVGMDLPFMIDLSIKLSYYDLIDEIILSKRKLVNSLWK